MSLFRISSLLLVLAFGACNALRPPLPDFPTPTLSPTLIPTETIMWFPPTTTPTVYVPPEIVPTPDQRPGINREVFRDTFAANDGWHTYRSAAGSVSYGRDELTLAVAQRRGYLASVRDEPELDDFYAEITASPSLCRNADFYGLMFRASSNEDGYRFVIACDGQIRLDRIRAGRVTLIQNWLPSGQVPPGSPLVLRLGVWALGREMRFFINDYYQFTARDALMERGKIGVFARSSDDTPLTVSFSDLVVYRINPAAIPAPPTPSPNP